MSSRVDYDRCAGNYNERYRVHSLDGIAQLLRRHARGRVLEAGCGTGRWLADIPGSIGIDRSPAMLAHAKAPAAVADAVRLPFPAATFDYVYCVNALHHFDDREEYFREVRRVLHNGGSTTAVAIDPTRIASWFAYDIFDGARELDLRRYATLEAIASMMESAGFRDIVIEEAEHTNFSWTRDEVLTNPLITRQSNSLIALLPPEVVERGLARIRAADPAQRFETDMIFYAVTGRLTD